MQFFPGKTIFFSPQKNIDELIHSDLSSWSSSSSSYVGVWFFYQSMCYSVNKRLPFPYSCLLSDRISKVFRLFCPLTLNLMFIKFYFNSLNWFRWKGTENSTNSSSLNIIIYPWLKAKSKQEKKFTFFFFLRNIPYTQEIYIYLFIVISLRRHLHVWHFQYVYFPAPKQFSEGDNFDWCKPPGLFSLTP